MDAPGRDPMSEARIIAIENRVVAFENRLTRLGEKIDRIRETLAQLGARVRTLEKRKPSQ